MRTTNYSPSHRVVECRPLNLRTTHTYWLYIILLLLKLNCERKSCLDSRAVLSWRNVSREPYKAYNVASSEKRSFDLLDTKITLYIFLNKKLLRHYNLISVSATLSLTQALFHCLIHYLWHNYKCSQVPCEVWTNWR